jgi:succinoglycan biosynthesis transport protein ExoP
MFSPNQGHSSNIYSSRRTIFHDEFRRFVRRNVKIIFMCGLVVGAGAMASDLFSTPQYSATTIVHIDTTAMPSNERQSPTGWTVSVEGFVNSEVELLQADATLRRAVREMDLIHADLSGSPGPLQQLADRLLRASPASANTQQRETRLVERLAEQTTIARRGETFVIGITVSNPSPIQASRLANGIATAYLAGRSDTDALTTRRSQTVLAARVADLAVYLRALEGRIDDMLLAAAAANLASQDGVSSEQKNAVAAILSQLADERQALFVERAGLTETLRQNELMVARYTGSVFASGIATSSNDTEGRRNALEARRTQIDERLLTLETATIDARDQLKDFLDTSGLAPNIALSLRRATEQAELTRGLYREAVQRWRDAQLRPDNQTPGARILSPAMPPFSDNRLPTPLVTMLGLLAGLAFGVGVGAVRERFIGGIMDAETVERATDLQVATIVPQVSRFDAGAPQDLITNDPVSLYAEAVRQLSRAVESWRGDDGHLSVLMTSPNASEGKSTLALSLGMHAALAGKPTLLIDIDLRQSALFDRLQWQVDATDGQLSDVLTGHTRLDDIETLTFQDPLTGLHVLGNASPPLDRPERLVTGQKIADLMQVARQRFDLIVIDSAPVLPFIDARSLLTFADVAILTMRYAQTPLTDVRHALRRLEQHRQPPIFGALTFVDQ